MFGFIYKMVSVNKLWIEKYIFTLSEENLSYFVIPKTYKRDGIKISKRQLSNILETKGNSERSAVNSKKHSKEVSKMEAANFCVYFAAKIFSSKRISNQLKELLPVNKKFSINRK